MATHRGYFVESFNARTFRAEVAAADFVQDNEALSAAQGTVRGLHFQRPPTAQGKLVRVLKGAIFDVAVDIRQGSPTFGRHVSAVLTAETGDQLWVPPGLRPRLLHDRARLRRSPTRSRTSTAPPTTAASPGTTRRLASPGRSRPAPRCCPTRTAGSPSSPTCRRSSPTTPAPRDGIVTRVLVTGGAGFIGSAVVRHLAGEARRRGAQRRQADLCGQPRDAALGLEPAELPLRAGRYRRPGRDGARSSRSSGPTP